LRVAHSIDANATDRLDGQTSRRAMTSHRIASRRTGSVVSQLGGSSQA